MHKLLDRIPRILCFPIYLMVCYIICCWIRGEIEILETPGYPPYIVKKTKGDK